MNLETKVFKNMTLWSRMRLLLPLQSSFLSFKNTPYGKMDFPSLQTSFLAISQFKIKINSLKQYNSSNKLNNNNKNRWLNYKWRINESLMSLYNLKPLAIEHLLRKECKK